MKKNHYYISDLESKRFKLNILRANVEEIEVKELRSRIFDNNIDVTILRISSSNIEMISRLDALEFEYFQADTLVYHFVNLETYKPQSLKNQDLIFIKATIDDAVALERMVRVVFKDYTNHYSSNKFINTKDALNGYVQWVIKFLDSKDKEVFIVYRNEEAIAFATCECLEDKAEGVLFGVIPDASGGGVYSDIIRFTQSYYKEKGMKIMSVSTQIQNLAVQKVWAREGFVLQDSVSTIHINSLLNSSVLKSRKYSLSLTQDMIDRCSKNSGDFNKLHFDSIYSSSFGFKQNIAHGLIPAGEISRIFGMEFPGQGTIILSYKTIFIQPMYPNQSYDFILNTYYHNPKNGVYMCLVKVNDMEGNICLLSYNKLINRESL
jgi:acyl dehydratase